MSLFKNFYRCGACSHKWSDVWEATCDDRCPKCSTSTSTYRSEDHDDEVVSPARVNAIAELNDRLRTTFSGGRIVLTSAVAALPDTRKAALFAAIKTFTAFTPDNDPHGERDFLCVTVGDERYFAKTEYYAPDMQHGSEDPADPKKTVRVMTIMEASEY